MASGSWTPASGCDNEKERKWGKRGEKATVSTHPKYSQARIYTTYATLSKEGYIGGLGCRNARIERRPSPIED